MKVYTIERKAYNGIHKDQEARALYEAAEKVFWIPPLDDIVEAVVNDNFAPVKESLLDVYKQLEDSPFTGPTVTRDIMGGIIYITTDGGRSIIVTPESICIDFRRDGDGSTIAAGEVIGHIWASDPGDLLHGIMVRCDDGNVDINDYNGPVHPQLGRAVYDSDFRRKFEAGKSKWFQEVSK